MVTKLAKALECKKEQITAFFPKIDPATFKGAMKFLYELCVQKGTNLFDLLHDIGMSSRKISYFKSISHPRIAIKTAKKIAKKVGVSYQAIGYIERGDYVGSKNIRTKIQEILEIPVDR